MELFLPCALLGSCLLHRRPSPPLEMWKYYDRREKKETEYVGERPNQFPIKKIPPLPPSSPAHPPSPRPSPPNPIPRRRRRRPLRRRRGRESPSNLCKKPQGRRRDFEEHLANLRPPSPFLKSERGGKRESCVRFPNTLERGGIWNDTIGVLVGRSADCAVQANFREEQKKSM